ncbi:MAG: DegV family protein [Intestinimonas sp.]|jgi:DegV family protein with EDD domain|nr:DegV family protein [Intestinimonas sp.]
MSDYAIVTDSSADLPQYLVSELELEVLPLSFTIGGTTYHDYPDRREMPISQFYDRIRQGEMATTAAVNVGDFIELLTPILDSGRDVLILAFSSGLSATYQSAVIAADELREKYPERRIEAVDTLSASLGQGMLVTLAARERQKGRSLEEVRDFVERSRLHLCHWFTVNDLFYLKRGGRVSTATAMVGSMLAIKPVMHMDNAGHLINVAKARGRTAALRALVDRMEATALERGDQTVFLSHGDCLDEAQKVADDVKARFGVRDVVFNHVGPVIGSHTGPGVIALFFLGSER